MAVAQLPGMTTQALCPIVDLRRMRVVASLAGHRPALLKTPAQAHGFMVFQQIRILRILRAPRQFENRHHIIQNHARPVIALCLPWL